MNAFHSLRTILLLALAFSVCGCDQKVSEEELQHLRTEDKTFKFVSEVVLRAEYNSRSPIVVKWTDPANLSTFGASLEEQEMVAQTVSELNQILQGTRFSIRLLEPQSSKANLKIHFAPMKEFDKIARENQFQYVAGNHGFFSYFTHGMGSIYKAVVLIDSHAGKSLKLHLIREEITQSLGPANDSKLFSSSIFYQKGSFGGNAPQFSELDKKLIHFFYAHLSPGYSEEKLAGAYIKHWNRERD